MKFLPNFEGFRLTPLFAPIFLTKDVLYLLSHISKPQIAENAKRFRKPALLLYSKQFKKSMDSHEFFEIRSVKC